MNRKEESKKRWKKSKKEDTAKSINQTNISVKGAENQQQNYQFRSQGQNTELFTKEITPYEQRKRSVYILNPSLDLEQPENFPLYVNRIWQPSVSPLDGEYLNIFETADINPRFDTPVTNNTPEEVKKMQLESWRSTMQYLYLINEGSNNTVYHAKILKKGNAIISNPQDYEAYALGMFVRGGYNRWFLQNGCNKKWNPVYFLNKYAHKDVSLYSDKDEVLQAANEVFDESSRKTDLHSQHLSKLADMTRHELDNFKDMTDYRQRILNDQFKRNEKMLKVKKHIMPSLIAGLIIMIIGLALFFVALASYLMPESKIMFVYDMSEYSDKVINLTKIIAMAIGGAIYVIGAIIADAASANLFKIKRTFKKKNDISCIDVTKSQIAMSIICLIIAAPVTIILAIIIFLGGTY